MNVKACRAAAVVQLAITIICASGASAQAEERGNGEAPVAASGGDESKSGENKSNDSRNNQPKVAEEGNLGGVTTKNVIGRESLESGGANQNSYEATQKVSGVTTQDSKGGAFADNLVIRGIHLISTSSYRLNGGFAIANNIFLPQEDKERVEILKGANALLFGIASPAGIVNLITKRPTNYPITSIGFAGTSFGTATGNLDVSRQFADGEFGIRTNVAGGHVETGVGGAGGQRGFASVAADWNPSDRFKARFDYEAFGLDVVEQSSLALLKPVNGVITLPNHLDPTKLMSGPWATYRAAGQHILGSAEYQIGAGWSALVEEGISETTRFKRSLSQVGSYDVVTGVGKETVTGIKDQETLNTYTKGELSNDAAWGAFTSHLTIGVNRNERDTNNPSNNTCSFTQNIYNPVPSASTCITPWSPRYLPQKSSDIGYYAYETIGFFDRLHVVGGARYLEYQLETALSTGGNSEVTTKVTSPAAGVIYDLTKNISVYASYMKALDETGSAPIGSANYGVSLPAAAATQKELGVRAADLYGVSGSLAYFDITRANAVVDPVTNLFGINGTIQYQGIEGTLKFRPDPRFTIDAGGLFLRAVQNSIDQTINGLTPENTPKYSGSLSVTYRPDWFKGLSLTAGAIYTGARPVNPQNQAFIPATTIFSLGAGYVTTIEGHRTHFNVSVSNLLDERYWSSAAQNALGIGMPRTIKFAAKVDF